MIGCEPVLPLTKTYSAECVGGSDLEKSELGVFDWKPPTPLLGGKKSQQTPSLYTNIILDKCCSSSVILHPSGSSYSRRLSKLLQILEVFLAYSNFREAGLKNY